MYFRSSRPYKFVIDSSAFSGLSDMVALTEMDLLSSYDIDIQLIIPVPWEMEARKSVIYYSFQRYIKMQQVSTQPSWEFPYKSRQLEEVVEALNGSLEEAAQARLLLTVHRDSNADGIVTQNSVLLKYRYPLVCCPSRIRVIDPADFNWLLRSISHGHNVKSAMKETSPDVINMVELPIPRDLLGKVGELSRLTEDKRLADMLRTALLGRLSLIYYTRDQIVFWDIHSCYDNRGKIALSNEFHMSYYFNYYVLLIWGMLDHLSKICNRSVGLPFSERRVYIEKEQFWRTVADQFPELLRFINSEEQKDWRKKLSYIRHSSAHNSLLQITDMLSEDSKSLRMTDKEVADEIAPECRDLEDMPKSARDIILKQRIDSWRINNAEIVASRTAVLDMGDEVGIINPVLDVDYHWEMLHKNIEVFTDAVERILNRTGVHREV